MDLTALTAESTPSSVVDALRTTCRKCHGKRVGDFGMNVRAGRCFNCDSGYVFTPVAFARVLELRAVRDSAALVAKGKALVESGVDAYIAREVAACGGPISDAAKADATRRFEADTARLRGSLVEARRRANAAWTVRRGPAPTLAAVRIAVFGENDTNVYAK
jgi:hypothetical protein